jgi:hypothetical protein
LNHSGGAGVNAIDQAVSSRLEGKRDQEEALALWKRLWAAFEAGGAEQARELLTGQLESPGDEPGEEAP